MGKIFFEVDDVTANRWRYLTQEQRGDIIQLVARYLEMMVENPEMQEPLSVYESPVNEIKERNQREWPDYKKLLDECRDEAKTNGLNQELLDILLKEDV